MVKIPQPWKNAATVIIAARIKPAVLPVSSAASGEATRSSALGQFDYKLLMLERSQRSTFMPSAHVFPGGVVGESDFSGKWRDMFCRILGIPPGGTLGARGLGVAPPRGAPRPPLYSPVRHRGRELPPELAFRICAIRETFEESGLLLCTSENKARHYIAELSKASGRLGSHLDNSDFVTLDKTTLKQWQDRVNRDDQAFLQMCLEMGLIPNIWRLNEWSNWFTPTNISSMHGNRRYDTGFFLTCLPGQWDQKHDNREIVSSRWINPLEILLEYREGKLWLAPPQLYEICRLCNATKLDDLCQYATERSSAGSNVTLPVRLTCTDGICAVLEGDDLYPSRPDFKGHKSAPEVNVSLQDLRDSSIRLHRINMHGPYDSEVLCNIEQKYHQLCPNTGQALLNRVCKELNIPTKTCSTGFSRK